MSDTDQRPRLSLRKRLLFLSLFLLLSLLGLEAALTLCLGETTIAYRPSEGGVLTPFIPGAEAELVSEEFHVRYQINRRGFRDEERDSASAEPRVLLLGDSFAEGWGVDQEKTFAALTEAELRREGRKVEIWNTARHGGNPLWYVAQAQERVKSLKPRVLVVQLFDNDLHDIRIYRRRFRFDEAGRLLGLADPKAPPGALRVFWARRQLVRLYVRARRAIKGRRRAHAEPFYRVGARGPSGLSPAEVRARHPVDLADLNRFPWAGFMKVGGAEAWKEALEQEAALLAQVSQLCREAGVELILLYIPQRAAFALHQDLASRRRANPHYHRIAAIAGAEGRTLIDGLEVLGKEAEPTALYYHYDEHFNAAGHAAMARALAKALRPLVSGGG